MVKVLNALKCFENEVVILRNALRKVKTVV